MLSSCCAFILYNTYPKVDVSYAPFLFCCYFFSDIHNTHSQKSSGKGWKIFISFHSAVLFFFLNELTDTFPASVIADSTQFHYYVFYCEFLLLLPSCRRELMDQLWGWKMIASFFLFL